MITIKEIIDNPDKTYNLVIEKQDRFLRLHSSKPKSEAEKIFGQISESSQAFFLGGMGMGYLAEVILEKTNKFCIIFEPVSPIFETVLKKRPELRKLISHPKVFFTQNISDITTFMKKHQLNDISFIIQRAYGEMFLEEINKAKDVIALHIRKQEVGNATLIRFGKIWTKNFFKNTFRYFDSQKLIDYKNIATNKPAIVIGAGPSLAEALPLLKEHADKAFLIACDTALPMLHKENIAIDFVVVVDPQEKNALYLRSVSDKNHKIIADPAIHDSCFEGYSRDNIILMDSAFPLYEYFQEFWGACGLLKSGGSVSTSAFDFARIINADPIIMIGQDLAFTKNKTHCTGHILSELSRSTHDRLHSYHTKHALTTHTQHTEMVKGRREKSFVPADVRFILFKNWFSEEIPKTTASVIVAGLEGAYLEGAQHLSAPDAFSFLSSPIDKDINIKTHRLCTKKIVTFLEHIEHVINNLIPLSKNIALNVKKAYTNNNLSLALQETRKLQHYLELPKNKKISKLISTSIQDSIQSALSMTEDTTIDEQFKILDKISSDIFDALKKLQKNINKSQKSFKL